MNASARRPVGDQALFSSLEDKWKREDWQKDQQWSALAHAFIPGLLIARLGKLRGRKLLWALVLVFVGTIAYLGLNIATYTPGPQLDILIEAPNTTYIGRSFTLTVHVGNVHSEILSLETIDFWEENFQNCELVATAPEALSASHNGIVGVRTWIFKLLFAPRATAAIDLELRPLRAGAHLLTFQICNAYYDCAPFETAIEVKEIQQ